MTLIISFCVIAGAFAFIGADESDAVTAGQMNVYIYNGDEWSDYLGMPGYNALQALQATEESIDADCDYILNKVNEWGPYTEMNSNYGNVTAISGLAEDEQNVWNVFVYNNGWSVGIDAIGYITPFVDGAAPSANIVLYYGADATEVPDDVVSHVTSFAAMTVVGGDDYKYTFELLVKDENYNPTVASFTVVEYVKADGTIATKMLTAADLKNGITLVGYGSNAYAALKDAVGARNISATETPGPYYGWLNVLFGLTTVSSGSNYTYWAQNTAGGVYLSYNLGAYSTLENVPSDDNANPENFVVSAFELVYMTY